MERRANSCLQASRGKSGGNRQITTQAGGISTDFRVVSAYNFRNFGKVRNFGKAQSSIGLVNSEPFESFVEVVEKFDFRPAVGGDGLEKCGFFVRFVAVKQTSHPQTFNFARL